jgi:CheY-like chemotaxis protein
LQPATDKLGQKKRNAFAGPFNLRTGLLEPVRDATQPETPARRKRTMRPRKTILCVEDNEQLLSVRKFLLETRGGYRVVACASAAEALEVLQAAAPGSLDLLLADLILPQMDGNELARRAKQLLPGLPILIVSGTVTSFERASAADGFLPKGACSAAEMLTRIHNMVARKRGPKKRPQSVPAPQMEQEFAVAS